MVALCRANVAVSKGISKECREDVEDCILQTESVVQVGEAGFPYEHDSHGAGR